MNALAEAGMPFRIHATMTQDWDESSPRPHHFLAELAKSYQVPFNIATYCTNPGTDPEIIKKNKNTFRNAAEMYRDLLGYIKKGYPVSTTPHVLKLGINWAERIEQYILFGNKSVVPKGYLQCQAGIRNCHINSDGGMFSCIPLWGEGINVYEVGVAKAVEHMSRHRGHVSCQICHNLSQWEYTAFFSLGNPKVALNTAKNIFRLLFQKKRRQIKMVDDRV